MDTYWTTPFISPGTYINVTLNLRLRTCQSNPRSAAESRADDLEDSGGGFSEYWEQAVGWLSGDAIGAQAGSSTLYGEIDDCTDVIHTSVGGSALLVSVVTLVCAALLGAIVTLSVWRWLQPSSPPSSELSSDDEAEKDENVESSPQSFENVGSLSATDTTLENVGSTTDPGDKPPKVHMPVVIQLCPAVQTPDPLRFVTQTTSSHFLAATIDRLSTQLDWLLGLGSADDTTQPSESLSATANSLLTTPRLQRKGIRRPRWRTQVSLPMGAGITSPGDKAGVTQWQRVEDMGRRMNWRRHDRDLDISEVTDPRLSAALQFYQQACPVLADQWSAACLVVNYTLCLLESELTSVGDRTPLQILQLRSFGSAANQTCIVRADRFDVLLVVQASSCGEMSVSDSAVCDDVPPGKLVLAMKETGPAARLSASHRLLKKDRVGDQFGMFLSHREVVRSAHAMLATALEKLKLRSRSLLDRLAFTLVLDQYEELQLSIDTRMLNGLGLGLKKITLSLTPAVRVTSHHHDPLPPLYAVPPWISQTQGWGGGGAEKEKSDRDSKGDRNQSRIMRSTSSQGVPTDLLWQLNCCELTSAFLASADTKLRCGGGGEGGGGGCQVMCQEILRAAFSSSGKDALLRTGEVAGSVLDAVVLFLLLESPPGAWEIPALPDRLSDCVHFLRSAVQSAWLPAFLPHNPHLLQRLPALRLLPLVGTPRQENLLAALRPDAVPTVLAFLEARLAQTGLRSCLKDEFSSEMWEYEFFIFG